MHRLSAPKFRPHSYTCLLAGFLVAITNWASLWAQTATPSPPPAGPGAPPPPGATAGDLKTSVTLVGVTDIAKNDALAVAAPLGQPLPLVLVVKEPPKYKSGELRVLSFQSADQPPAIATAKLRTDGKEAEFVTVALDKPGQIPFSLEFDRLRPAKTYTGRLVLTSAGLTPHQWNITLTTAGLGTLAVDPVGTLKFTTLPPFTWLDGAAASSRSFSFTLRDKSGGGPYSHVNVRFESSTPATSKEIKSNFNLDKLSFWEPKPKPPAGTVSSGVDHDQRIDLEGRGPDSGNVTLSGTRTFTSRVASLSPGEYSGTLRFGADGAADDSADAKLALLIQVRHHWLIPVLVILAGSLVGWFSSKYVVGARKASGLAQQIKQLRADAGYLARHTAPRAGWEFPSEAVSLGYARVLVSLNRLARLSASPIEVLFHGTEIDLALQSAQLRLAALKSVYDIRLRVQPVADGRPAAQLAIGRLLRSANDLLELPTFGEVEKAALAKLVEALETWANAATFAAAYKQAILDRRRSSDCPLQADLEGVAKVPVRDQLKSLFPTVPDDQTIAGQSDPKVLKESDVKIAWLALLWREREEDWAEKLADLYEHGTSLNDAFHFVDIQFWQALKTAQKVALEIALDSASQANPQAYEIVEMSLEAHASTLETRRIHYHPLRVGWRIEPKNGQVRTMETDGLTLVQYFPSPENVDIKASLLWGGDEILINTPLRLQVVPNPDYEKHGMFSADWTEYSVIVVAAIFAIVTAMGTQYDSTFGTGTQYIGLFLWAAGAGTGGNLFSQLGTTSAPGGATATLGK